MGMNRLTEADLKIGQRIDPQKAKLREVLEWERQRIRLLMQHRILPVKPDWWNSEKLGLYPVRLLKRKKS